MHCVKSETSLWIIEDQVFSLSYNLAPSPSPTSPVSKLNMRQTGRLRKLDNLLMGEGGGAGEGEGARSYDDEKAWHYIIH